MAERQQLHLALVFLLLLLPLLFASELLRAASDVHVAVKLEVSGSVCFPGDLKRQSALSFLSFLLFTVDSH